jgi:hypothetical protein
MEPTAAKISDSPSGRGSRRARRIEKAAALAGVPDDRTLCRNALRHDRLPAQRDDEQPRYPRPLARRQDAEREGG